MCKKNSFESVTSMLHLVQKHFQLQVCSLITLDYFVQSSCLDKRPKEIRIETTRSQVILTHTRTSFTY
jgi:hypothetical protein